MGLPVRQSQESKGGSTQPYPGILELGGGSEEGGWRLSSPVPGFLTGKRGVFQGDWQGFNTP